jgi:hypothetical protein
MAEFSNNSVQTVNPGESIVFTENPVPCRRGFVRYREGTGAFRLKGYVPYNGGCRCRQPQTAVYLIDFGANIAVPTGETVGTISVAVMVDGITIPSSTMAVTPAAVEQFSNVSRAINAQVDRGCYQTISIRNTSQIPILVQNANVIFSRPDLTVSR